MALDTRMQSHTAFKPCTASTGWKVSPALWDAEFVPLLLTLSPTCQIFFLSVCHHLFHFSLRFYCLFYSFLIFFHFPPSCLSPVFLPSPYQLEDFTVQWKHLSVEQRSTCWTVCWVHCCYKITLNVHRCLREWVGVLVCVILCVCTGVCVCGCHSGAYGGEETGNARCASAWPLSNWGAGVTWGGTSRHMIWTWWVACLEAKSNTEMEFFQRKIWSFYFSMSLCKEQSQRTLNEADSCNLKIQVLKGRLLMGTNSYQLKVHHAQDCWTAES